MVTWVYNAYDGVKDDSIIHDGHGYELVRRIYAKEDRWTIIGLTQGHDASIYLAPRAPGEVSRGVHYGYSGERTADILHPANKLVSTTFFFYKALTVYLRVRPLLEHF